MQVISLDIYITLVFTVFVLLLGRFIIKRVPFLRKYSIPDAVVGGIIVATFLLLLRVLADFRFEFDTTLRDPLMLAFFSSIGLLADFSAFKKGGKRLAKFVIVIFLFLFLQNIFGIVVASFFKESFIMGLLAGSISLSGGHGTAAAWATAFSAEPYYYKGALEVAMACATFGLLIGGVIGGPVASFIIRKNHLHQHLKDMYDESAMINLNDQNERRITQKSFIESLALLSICICGGIYLDNLIKSFELGFTLPTFVYSLFIGVLLRNSLNALHIHEVFDREVGLLGNVSLSLFLVFVILSIDLIQLAYLALPLISLLLVQTGLIVLYAIFVVHRFCGNDFDSAVMTAGFCGFGMGATPTAMVNMQAVCMQYGVSQLAFIIVPLCGAFFIDILNAVIINFFLILF